MDLSDLSLYAWYFASNSGGKAPVSFGVTTGLSPMGASYLPAYVGGPGITYYSYVLAPMPFTSDGTNVVVLGGLGGSEVEFNTWIVSLICAREGDPFRGSISVTRDFDIEAVGVELRARIQGWFWRHCIAVKSQELSSEDIEAWFDVTWDFEKISVVLFNELLVCPQFLKAS
jgi:hypothetical protein